MFLTKRSGADTAAQILRLKYGGLNSPRLIRFIWAALPTDLSRFT